MYLNTYKLSLYAFKYTVWVFRKFGEKVKRGNERFISLRIMWFANKYSELLEFCMAPTKKQFIILTIEGTTAGTTHFCIQILGSACNTELFHLIMGNSVPYCRYFEAFFIRCLTKSRSNLNIYFQNCMFLRPLKLLSGSTLEPYF